jgi:flagellar assembly factor FliW
MNILVTLSCVSIVVLLYLHVIYQLKTSNDLEIYEIELPNKSRLEEVCNLRQPIVFNHDNESIQKCIQSQLNEYHAFDITVIDASNVKVPLKLENAFQLFKKEEKYYSANNEDFLNETMVKRNYEELDYSLRPPMVCKIHYDLIFGSQNATTQLRYSNYYRNFFYVTNHNVTIKLAPPKNSKYLHVIQEYENQDYYSPINPWLPQEQYKSDIDKVKFLEITLHKGQLLFIPAYWWYSIKLNKEACVCTFQYRTVMNIVSILPEICLGLLQQTNTKTKMKEFKESLPGPTSSDSGSRT